MKLHYSQTLLTESFSIYPVSVPYEITLLSNRLKEVTVNNGVSVPYEITLLSNVILSLRLACGFQYLMKLHYSQTNV